MASTFVCFFFALECTVCENSFKRTTGYGLLQEAVVPLICHFALIRYTLLMFKGLIVTLSLWLLLLMIIK